MKALRIGIDASGIAGGKEATGLQRYTACLIKYLVVLAEAENIELFLYFARPVRPAAKQPGQLLASLMDDASVHWRTAPFERGWYRVFMGLAMHRDRLDLFHFPAPLMSGYCPVPSTVTFHDLAAASLSGPQTEKERRYLPAALDAGKRATTLIAVSQSAGQEVSRSLGRSDVQVILEGVDLAQFKPSPENVAEIKQRYGLERYILCVGTLQTRKNHLGLIQAFAQIADQAPHTLVIAGRDGSGAEAIRQYLEVHPGLRVQLIGYVEDALLPALYSGADALVLPSLWEGFGLPLIEAMACGTPVLTSNVSSLVEIGGDAVLLVDPQNIDDIARQLHKLLTDQALRAKLIEAGFVRARSMSWETTAKQTIDVYRRTVELAAKK